MKEPFGFDSRFRMQSMLGRNAEKKGLTLSARPNESFRTAAVSA
jgi:hypothetical protein